MQDMVVRLEVVFVDVDCKFRKLISINWLFFLCVSIIFVSEKRGALMLYIIDRKYLTFSDVMTLSVCVC